MIEAYKKFWKGYVDFEGRSTRSDYWFAYSAHVLITFAYLFAPSSVWRTCMLQLDSSDLLAVSVHLSSYLSFLPMVLLRVLPGIALTVRRLRDAGYQLGVYFYCL